MRLPPVLKVSYQGFGSPSRVRCWVTVLGVKYFVFQVGQQGWKLGSMDGSRATVLGVSQHGGRLGSMVESQSE